MLTFNLYISAAPFLLYAVSQVEHISGGGQPFWKEYAFIILPPEETYQRMSPFQRRHVPPAPTNGAIFMQVESIGKLKSFNYFYTFLIFFNLTVPHF